MTDLKWTKTMSQDQMQRTLDRIKELDVRNTDVFLLGYPKSGTTWVQELIWLLVNDLNYEGAKAFVDERVPVLEATGYFDKMNPNQSAPECLVNSLEVVKSMKNPRCIKTHIKWDFLPEAILNATKKPKIIYIARNPKDVCVSAFYYITDLLKIVDCSFDDYCQYFLGRDHEQCGKYWDHVLSLWNRRHQPNILFIRYEDMKNKFSSVIENVADFLGKTINTQEKIDLMKWLDFDTMKNNPAVNHVTLYQKPGFIRTGKIGDHKNIMKEEIIKKFDSWIEENLKHTDYTL